MFFSLGRAGLKLQLEGWKLDNSPFVMSGVLFHGKEPETDFSRTF